MLKMYFKFIENNHNERMQECNNALHIYIINIQLMFVQTISEKNETFNYKCDLNLKRKF